MNQFRMLFSIDNNFERKLSGAVSHQDISNFNRLLQDQLYNPKSVDYAILSLGQLDLSLKFEKQENRAVPEKLVESDSIYNLSELASLLGKIASSQKNSDLTRTIALNKILEIKENINLERANLHRNTDVDKFDQFYLKIFKENFSFIMSCKNDPELTNKFFSNLSSIEVTSIVVNPDMSDGLRAFAVNFLEKEKILELYKKYLDKLPSDLVSAIFNSIREKEYFKPTIDCKEIVNLLTKEKVNKLVLSSGLLLLHTLGKYEDIEKISAQHKNKYPATIRQVQLQGFLLSSPFTETSQSFDIGLIRSIASQLKEIHDLNNHFPANDREQIYDLIKDLREPGQLRTLYRLYDYEYNGHITNRFMASLAFAINQVDSNAFNPADKIYLASNFLI